MLLKFIGRIKASIRLIQQTLQKKFFNSAKKKRKRNYKTLYENSLNMWVCYNKKIYILFDENYLFLFYDCDLYVFYKLYLICTKNTILFTPNIETQI